MKKILGIGVLGVLAAITAVLVLTMTTTTTATAQMDNYSSSAQMTAATGTTQAIFMSPEIMGTDEATAEMTITSVGMALALFMTDDPGSTEVGTPANGNMVAFIHPKPAVIHSASSGSGNGA